MKLLGVFRFELSYQLRSLLTWLAFAVLLVFAFSQTRIGFLSDALRDDFFLNAPSVIAAVTVFTCLIWLLIGATISGEAGARDISTGMHPLAYTAPVSKAEYLGGRFLAAFALNAMLLLSVPIGSILAVYVTGVDGAAIGPFRPAAYLTSWFFIALPNAFVVTAIQFSLAALTREAKASYLGSVIVFFCAFILSFTVALGFGQRDLGRLIDPLGFITIIDLSLEWTSIEKNTRLIALEGNLLRNRLVWITIALGTLAFTHWRFRFVHHAATDLLSRLLRRGVEHSPTPADARIASEHISIPDVPRTFGFSIHVRQTLALAWTSFKEVAMSRSGLIAWGLVSMIVVVMVGLDMEYQDIPIVPRTDYLLAQLTASLTNPHNPWMMFPLVIVLYGGELIWREREARMSEITDSTSVPEWVPFVSKFLGLSLALVVWLVFAAALSMLIQLMMGYTDLEPALYLKTLFALQLTDYVLFAVLVLVIHVVVNQKPIGQIAAVIAYLFIALSSTFRIEHNMLVYASAPGWSYSDMRGFGPSIGPWLWFKLYWAAWALLLAVVARLLWVRGIEGNFGTRLKLARRRITRATAASLAFAVALILTTGGFIFYNTNVLNGYETVAEGIARTAEYELRYKRYERVPQPMLTGTRLHVEIFPERRTADIRGTYVLVNSSTVPLDSIHLTTPGVEIDAVKFDRPAKRVIADDRHRYHIYSLDEPLAPGDTVELSFEVHFETHGFRNSGIDPSVVANGTYFTSREWLPFIGYVPYIELTGATDRRKHGLTPRPLVPAIDDIQLQQHNITGEQGVAFEAVLCTNKDQTAVVAGALRRTWTERGRRCFDYASDAPIGNDYRFFSARYAVHSEQWKNVGIRIYYHPTHGNNLERKRASIIASLEYFSKQFGPYPYGHLTFVERPGNGMSLHASPGFVDAGEGFSLWNPDADTGGLDLAFAAVSHEIAHQWWGGQVTPAFVAGAGLLSESLAWYSAVHVVEKTKGSEQVRLLRRFFLQPQPIPPIRQSVPLLRAIDPYAMYRKGQFAMWAMSKYAGEDKINGALRRMVEKYGAPGSPLATSLDLHRELKAVTPDSLQYLLYDLFEANTFWELEAERATAKQTASGEWQVTLVVNARKEVVDSTGASTDVPMNDLIDIGVYAPAEDGLGEALYLQRQRMRSGKHTIVVTVARKPAHAGIDPDRLMISLEPNDNMIKLDTDN